MQNITFSQSDKMIAFINAAILLTSLVTYLNFWKYLPALVPTHFSGPHTVDQYGPKGSAFILIAVMTGTVVMMLIIRNRPRLFNFPGRITPENSEKQIAIARGLLATLCIHISLMTHILVWSIIAAALKWSSAPYFVYGVLLLAGSICVHSFVGVSRAYRASL